MLTLDVSEQEFFNEDTGEIKVLKPTRLQLEHSLVSMSKWESKWEIPFLGKGKKTDEQIRDYIRCMTITQNVDPSVYFALTSEDISKVDKYINKKMTATWFSNEEERRGRQKTVTSEVIYYWMITLGIPVEFQKWHLNRLMTLIKIVSIENSPKKKMGKRALANRNTSLNAQRIARMKSGRG